MKNPYLSLLRTAWQYARHERVRYVLIYSLFVGANLVGASYPLLFGWFVDALQKQTNASQMALVYGGSYLGLKLLEWAFHGPARVMERRLAFQVSRNFLDELYHQTLHLPIGWHKENHSGATISRIRKAYDALKQFFQNGFVYLHAISKFVFSFAAMLYFSPLFGTIAVLLGLLTVRVIRQFDKPFVRAVDETNEREHQTSSTLFDSLSNILTVVTLRLEKRMEISLSEKVQSVLSPFMRQVRINEWKWFIASMLIAAIYITITVGYVHQNWEPGTMFRVGGLVTLLGYVNQFTSVFSDVAWQYTQIVQANTDVQTARSIGEAYVQRSHPNKQTPLPDHWKRIEITGLNFQHPQSPDTQRRPPALQGVHLRLERGKRTALIGESGSGKTTPLALLRGLYTPDPGAAVRIDGQTAVDFCSIADTVTLFPQEPEIFENTVAYNITLGLPFEKDDIEAVCETARFADIVRHLPSGLDTPIQEKGVNLSGGQKQRLALARGLLAAKSSDIILLDEPTSSVDPKTEFEIYHRMLAGFSDKAVVSTLHRLHLLPLFDYIYVLRDGLVVDEGTFVHLRQHSPTFQAMWDHQKTQSGEEVVG